MVLGFSFVFCYFNSYFLSFMIINVNYFIFCVVICSWITLFDWRHDDVAYYWVMDENVLWICHTHTNYMVQVTIISMTINDIISFCSTFLLKYIVNIIQWYIHFLEIFFRKRACFTISVSCWHWTDLQLYW